VKEREKRKNKWSKCSHLPPPTSRPMSSWSPSEDYFVKSPPLQFIAEQDIVEYTFSQLGSSVPVVSPLNLSPTPHQLAGGAEWETETSMLCKHFLAITKTSLCYQCCSGHKSKVQHHTAAVKKVNSIPVRPSAPHFAVTPHPQWLLSSCTLLFSGAKYKR